MSTQHHGTVCKTCRKRGKKCDKLLPECSTCLSKGTKCEGYTFKWSGVASRGKLAGKQIPVSDSSPIIPRRKPSKAKSIRDDPARIRPELNTSSSRTAGDTIQQTPFVCTSEQVFQVTEEGEAWEGQLSDVCPMLDLDIPIGDAGDGWQDDIDFSTLPYMMELESHNTCTNTPQALALVKPLNPLNVPPEIKHVLDYYLTEVSPRLCVDNNSSTNPYSQYILPLAIETPSLLYACAALAACQFNIRLGDGEHHMKALRFKGKAMKRLQESLYSNERAKEQGPLATILMLSLCDISLGGSAGFDSHFLGARRLIDLRGQQRTPGNFVEQYIAWLDTMAATSHFRSPIFSASEITDLTLSPDASDPQSWSYDVFPCPVEYFEIIHEIVDLYKSQVDPAFPTPTVLSIVQSLKGRILRLPVHIERGQYWLHLTEAYRFAIVLYLIRLFHIDSKEDEIQWLTHSVFHHAKSTIPSTGWADQMLWPLFHAALEIKDDSRKEWLRERAKSMQHSGGFRNVESAMEILERVWSGTESRNYMDFYTRYESGCLLFV